MKKLKVICIGAVLVALPMPAAAQEMCAALQRIAAAAREPVPFASLVGPPSSLVPGYDYCRVETGAGPRIICSEQMAPKNLIADAVTAQVRDCLGGTISMPPGWPDNDVEVRTTDLVITAESHCDERCHVGRIASLVIRRREADGAPPPR